MTTVALKTAIYNLIAATTTTFERGQVEKDATFPYSVYALGDSSEGDTDNTESIKYPLEVEVYDHDLSKNTAVIEGIADSIDSALNRIHYIGTDFYMHIIREGRHPNYPTPDEFTFRRNLRYQVKVYTKGVS